MAANKGRSAERNRKKGQAADWNEEIPPDYEFLKEVQQAFGTDKDEADNEHTTYITVETKDGKLETLKINLDDDNFSASEALLEYLVKQGEINPNHLQLSEQADYGGNCCKVVKA